MIEAATEAHVLALAADIDPRGARELRELFHQEPDEAIRRALNASSHAWAMKTGGGVLLALVGVAPISAFERSGRLWIISAASLCRHRLAFARMSYRLLREVWNHYDRLENLFDHRHTDVVKWGRWLGAVMTPLNEEVSRFELWR